MNRKTLALLIGFAAVMLSIGLLLPSILERAFSNQDGTESLEVEAINYDSGSATLMDLLNLINSSAEISYQYVQEGYHYNQKTAAEHAVDLLAVFLSRAGFENASAVWKSKDAALRSDAEATLVAVPEFPSPWNAIIWNVNLSLGDGSDANVIFDDTSGSFLAGDCLLLAEEDDVQKSFSSSDLIEKLVKQCVEAYVDGLDGLDAADLISVEEYDWEHYWGFAVIDSEKNRSDIMLIIDANPEGIPHLSIEPMGIGYDNMTSGSEP